ncbi:hypothetical protein CK203_027567 [Vitis vinifera]|uniref:Uncharacterized protein n=1 Tax=Vitis vinifera TaxID=29760 RepID=A0A438JBD9_VITVI|nr:hypothetical protein CK203_027567 [Vitis vinifera]
MVCLNDNPSTQLHAFSNSEPDEKNIILPGEDISIQDMDIFHGHLVLFLNNKGCSMICSINMPIDVNYKVLKFLLILQAYLSIKIY